MGRHVIALAGTCTVAKLQPVAIMQMSDVDADAACLATVRTSSLCECDDCVKACEKLTSYLLLRG